MGAFFPMGRLTLLLALLFFAATFQAGAGVAGEPFSDPEKTQQMPPGWEQMPVEHEKEDGDVDLAITLDQHLYPALLPLIGDYAKGRGLKVAVREGTCGISAGKLAKKSVDIAGFCCPPGEFDRLPGLKFHTIGIVAIAVIVHPENPVGDLSAEQVREIFMGTVQRWSDVRDLRGNQGPDIQMQAVARLHCKLRPGHWRLILDNEDIFSPRLLEVGVIPDMISVVSENPGAIGYEAVQMIRRYRQTGRVKTISIGGMDPNDPRALLSGGYPFYRTLGVATWEGKGNIEAEGLVQYLIEAAGGLDPALGIVSAKDLRDAGWKFRGDELVGGPR